jgi:tRNA1(Val) A37 N6-methylase TrmN6
LLAPGGHFATILPAGIFPGFTVEAGKRDLHPDRMTVVRSFANKPARRVLSSFSKSALNAPVQQELIIFDTPGRFSSGYLELTSSFHNF